MPDLSRTPEALAVAEDLLDRSGRGVMTRDFDLFAGCFSLPHKVSNFDEEYIIDDPVALRRGFDKVCDEFVIMGVTDFVRDCIAAEMIDPQTIHFAHVSHLMAGARRIKPPYPCFSVVHLYSGQWRLVATDQALDANSGQARGMKLAAAIKTAEIVQGAAESCPPEVAPT